MENKKEGGSPKPTHRIICPIHGPQEVFVPKDRKRWDPKATEILREKGLLGPEEEYEEAECPICAKTKRFPSTRQARLIPKDEGKK